MYKKSAIINLSQLISALHSRCIDDPYPPTHSRPTWGSPRTSCPPQVMVPPEICTLCSPRVKASKLYSPRTSSPLWFRKWTYNMFPQKLMLYDAVSGSECHLNNKNTVCPASWPRQYVPPRGRDSTSHLEAEIVHPASGRPYAGIG